MKREIELEELYDKILFKKTVVKEENKEKTENKEQDLKQKETKESK